MAILATVYNSIKYVFFVYSGLHILLGLRAQLFSQQADHPYPFLYLPISLTMLIFHISWGRKRGETSCTVADVQNKLRFRQVNNFKKKSKRRKK